MASLIPHTVQTITTVLDHCSGCVSREALLRETATTREELDPLLDFLGLRGLITTCELSDLVTTPQGMRALELFRIYLSTEATAKATAGFTT